MPSPQKQPFGRKLSDFLPLFSAEKKLLDAVALGEMCWLCDKGNPVRPEKKTRNNEIRASFIRFLALGGDDEAFVHEKGVQLCGTFVSGELNLTNCSNVNVLRCLSSHFDTTLMLGVSHTSFIELYDSSFPGFHADNIKAQNGLKMDSITCDGVISLKASIIEGILDFKKATINQLQCSSAIVKGDMHLSETKTTGLINLNSIQVEGGLLFMNSNLGVPDKNSPDRIILNCDQARISNTVFFNDHFQAYGGISFINASIGGDFLCEGNAQFLNPNGKALACDKININGSLSVREGCLTEGSAIFPGSKIQIGIDFKNSIFNNLNGKAIDFQSSKIGGDVLLSNNFHAEGQVRFKNATIGGDFCCEEDSSIEHPHKTALHCGGISVGGNVFLRERASSSGKLEINGSVNFIDAKISKGFDCSYADITHLVAEEKKSTIAAYALNLQGADIGGMLTLRNTDLYGSLSLLKTHVDTLNDKPNSWPQPPIVQQIGISQKIKNFFSGFWIRHTSSDQPHSATTPRQNNQDDEGELQSIESDDSAQTTPAPTPSNNQSTSTDLSSIIALDGFSYNQIAGGSPTDAATRLKWLKLQRPSSLWEKFRPQPFEQIIRVLRHTGHEEQATRLLINKYDHKQDVRIEKAKGFWGTSWAWLKSSFFWFFLGRLTGYGKRPARLLGLLAFLFCSSALWYDLAASKGVFAPSHPLVFLKYDQKPDCRLNWVNCINDGAKNPELQAYTAFSPWLYSLDVMLPIINLHQESDWGPKIEGFEVKVFGATFNIHDHITWFVMWSQIILGWLGSFMLIAMLSGWLQKEQ